LDFTYIENGARGTATLYQANSLRHSIYNKVGVKNDQEMNRPANRDNPDFDEELLARMSAELNDLIRAEIGNDHFLFDISVLEGLQKRK
jgi:hypothetical protein